MHFKITSHHKYHTTTLYDYRIKTIRNILMKLLTTTFLFTAITVVTFANNPATFNTKKEKILTKVTTRITKIKNRKSCFQNATSLETMQSCRVEKNKNKPFKLKENMTFEQKKSKILHRITKRLSKINKRKSCVENALDNKALKACKPQKKVKH